nr:MAG TPA: hypothetical protein [Caudoviricetes sp.]
MCRHSKPRLTSFIWKCCKSHTFGISLFTFILYHKYVAIATLL